MVAPFRFQNSACSSGVKTSGQVPVVPRRKNSPAAEFNSSKVGIVS
jgi:hypothetical protein